MVYTVTLNPAIDYYVDVNHFTVGQTNRTTEEAIYPGGKGINVSKVLSNLSVDSVALGFKAGLIGKTLSKLLLDEGIFEEFIEVEGETRINVKLRTLEGTEINGRGPVIGKREIDILREKLNTVSFGDVLVLGGSLPRGISHDIYETILDDFEGRGVLTVVDTSGDALSSVLKHRPFLIKPNIHEVSDIIKEKVKSKEDAINAAKKLRQMGAMNVIISMGKDGAVMVDENDEVYSAKAPEGECVNAVGAGDAMVAGFISAYIDGDKSYEECFEYALCVGSAKAFNQGYVTKAEIDRVYSEFKSK